MLINYNFGLLEDKEKKWQRFFIKDAFILSPVMGILLMMIK